MRLAKMVEEIKSEGKEFMIVFILIILLLFGMALIEHKEKLDEVSYLKARIDALELAIRWGSNKRKGGE